MLIFRAWATWGPIVLAYETLLYPQRVLCISYVYPRREAMLAQPRSQSSLTWSLAMLNVTSSVKLVGKIRTRFQASSRSGQTGGKET